MSSAAAIARTTRRNSGADDAVRAPFAEVNLDEKDHAKAIERSQEPALPPSEDTEGGDAPATSDSREWNRRIKRVKRTYDQKFAEQEARHQREMRDIRNRLDSLGRQRNDDRVPDADAAHEAEMGRLRDQLEAALEAGQSKEAARLQTEISRREAAFWAKKRGADDDARVQREEEQRRERARQAAAADRRDAGSEGPTKEAKRWMKANDEWWDDDEFRIEHDAAVTMDEELIAEGSDPDSEEHYVELVERLKDKFPKLKVRLPKGMSTKARKEEIDDETDVEPRRVSTRRPAVPSFSDRGPSEGRPRPRPREGRRVVLTAQQRSNMLKFGMDPDSDKDVRAYAESVEETDRAYEDR